MRFQLRQTYADYLYACGLGQSTVRTYTAAVGHAQRRLRAWGWDLADVPGPVVADYVAERPATKATRTRLRSALEHYWRWIGREAPPLGAIPTIREPRRECRALPEDEVDRLLEVAHRWDGPEGLAVLLLYYMALRRFEAAKMVWDDVGERDLRILGKGGSLSSLPLHAELVEPLAVRRRETGGSRWVFPGRSGDGPVHPMTVTGWCAQVGEAAGVAFTTHQLRHSALATMLDNSGDLRATMEYARHVNPRTTLIYTRTTRSRLVELGATLGRAPVSEAA